MILYWVCLLLLLVFLFLGGLLWISGWFRKPRSAETMLGIQKLPEYSREHIQFYSGIPETDTVENQGPQFLWLGHGTMFISWGGKHFIVDPIAREAIFIVKRWIERWHPDQLFHHLDGILLTHGHMDHLCNDTLMTLPATDLLIPDRTESFLKAPVRDRHRVVKARWHEAMDIQGVQIIPVEARHGGWRYPWQRGYFAVGYILKFMGTTLYVAGDSAWGKHFAAIGERYQPDYAILPIGAYSPRVYLKQKHMNPDEAVKAYLALGCLKMIPMHFGTYRLSLERMSSPLRRFVKVAKENEINWELPIWRTD